MLHLISPRKRLSAPKDKSTCSAAVTCTSRGGLAPFLRRKTSGHHRLDSLSSLFICLAACTVIPSSHFQTRPSRQQTEPPPVADHRCDYQKRYRTGQSCCTHRGFSQSEQSFQLNPDKALIKTRPSVNITATVAPLLFFFLFFFKPGFDTWVSTKLQLKTGACHRARG